MIQKTLLAFIAGTVLAAWLPHLLSAYWLIGMVPLALLIIRVSLPVSGLLLGFVWCSVVGHQMMADRWPVESAGQSHVVEGEVVGLPVWVGDSLRFDFRTTSTPDVFPEHVRVYWYRAGHYIYPGQQWKLHLRLNPPLGRLNFSGFDYEHYLFEQGIGATARVVDRNLSGSELQLAGRRGFRAWFDQQRLRLAENIQARTVDLEVAAVKRALLVGDRSGLDDETRAMMQQTGTAHLLAISGLHIGMVASFGGVLSGALWWFLSCLGIRMSRRSLMLRVGWLCAFFYAGLAGFSVPTQRALIMLAVAVLALSWRRRVLPFDGLLVAAALVVLISPMAVLSLGFWLSFLAVAYLIWGFSWRIGKRHKWRGAKSLLWAQWLVSVGLLPLSLTQFGHWSPASFLANGMAIPWVSALVLPSLLISTLAEELGVGLALLSQFSDAVLAFLLWGLGWIQAHVAVSFIGRNINPILLSGALLGAVWLLAPHGWPARWLGALLLLPLMIEPKMGGRNQDLRIEVLDVGAGSSVLVSVGDYRLLYDVGPGREEDYAPAAELISRWPTHAKDPRPLKLIDDLVLSHPNRNHLGGSLALSDKIWVDRLRPSPWVEDVKRWRSGELIPCRRGQHWSVGQWRFELLHPGLFLPDLGGNSSCVLRIFDEHHSILLTGGLDRHGEHHLTLMYPELKADVLMLANGGHHEGASGRWLDALQPSWALISASGMDRNKRRNQEVLDRLQERRIKFFNTATCGALELTFASNVKDVQIKTAVAERPRFWRDGSDC